MGITSKFRRFIFSKLAKRQVAAYGNGFTVNKHCKFTSKTHIGNNCHFNGMTVSGNGEVVIGDNFHSGGGCRLITQNHNYDEGERLPYDQTYIIKGISIGKNVWIGDAVILLPGVKLGDGVVVQAGSVVHGEIPELAVIGGNPARVIKYRNKEHYDRLEEQKKYW